MGQGLKVAFSCRGQGWLELSFEVQGRHVSSTFSDVPFDSLRHLAESLLGFYENGLPSATQLNGEPEVDELRLEPGPGLQAALRLVRLPDRTRMQDTEAERFGMEAPARDIVLSFWRALRRLEGEFAANGATIWRFEFPHRAVSRLGDALRQ